MNSINQYETTLISCQWWIKETKKVIEEYNNSPLKERIKLLPKMKYLMSKAKTEKKELIKLIGK